jgi:transcriptional regulator with XRE-family HTH domain
MYQIHKVRIDKNHGMLYSGHGVTQMEGFGSYLKGAREAKKISLREISRVTRIRHAILEDIEKDQGEFLLPEVVVKNFIEAYAAYIGLDAEEAVSRYVQWRKGSSAVAHRELPPDGKRKIFPRYIFAGAAGLIIVIIVSLFALPGRTPHEGAGGAAMAKAGRGQRRAVPSNDLQSSPSRSLATEGALLSPPPADAQTEGKKQSSPLLEHTLVIKASERTWIQIQDGSALPFDVILYPGDSYTRTSSHPLAIVIGNAGGVQVIFDGKGLDIAGGGGEVMKLKLPSPEEG